PPLSTFFPYTTLFRSGIILYDATNDHSAKIASTGLTEDQKRELNTLSNHWLNQIRHYFWDVLQIQKTNPNAKINGYYNGTRELTDRKSTRLNSSHVSI